MRSPQPHLSLLLLLYSLPSLVFSEHSLTLTFHTFLLFLLLLRFCLLLKEPSSFSEALLASALLLREEIALMEPMESCVPPGFRFHPTDEELVGYYLRKKVASQKFDLDVIRDIDLYRIEPWDLQEKCRIGQEEQKEWYFFSHKDKKYPTGTRTNRATMAGFWKATGRDKAVYDRSKLIGMRKTLVFYKGRAPNGQKSDWIMHEYRLESDENGPPQEEGWVVCRAFKKRSTGQTKAIEGWEPSYFYDEPSIVGIDPIDYAVSMQNQNILAPSFMCKQELEADNVNFMLYSDPFIQLPQLDSPSLTSMNRPASTRSLVSETNEEDDLQNTVGKNCKKVTDWRALDKFVASQLSHEDIYEGRADSRSDLANISEMREMLLLQSYRDESNNFDGVLNSTSERDFGICIFEKC